jgi:adenosylmethionine-8-amino-7-oxononanoate aminotransferase
LWLGVDFTVDKKTKELFPLAGLQRIVDRAREKGVIIKLMGQALELSPPLVIEKDEIDEGVQVIFECIEAEAKHMGIS